VGAGAARLQQGKTFESFPQQHFSSRPSSGFHFHPLQQRHTLAITTLRLSEGVSFTRSCSRLQQQMPPIQSRAGGGVGGVGGGDSFIDMRATDKSRFSSLSSAFSIKTASRAKQHGRRREEEDDDESGGLSFMTASADSNGIHDTSILSSYQTFPAEF
jgi:hypothetical protein